MQKGVSEKDIKDFIKYANKLDELAEKIKDKAYINADIGVLSLVSKDKEVITNVFVDGLSTGYL